jgi:pimeloyl-ACP methyl ester carboxylesterase
LQLSGKALSSYVRQYKALAAMNKHQVELIWGAGDREVSSKDVDFLKSSFEKIDVFEVRGSGHGLMAESPELVTDFIQKNISKLGKKV